MSHKVPARKIAVGLAALAVAVSTSFLARTAEPAQADPAQGGLASSLPTDDPPGLLCVWVADPGYWVGVNCPDPTSPPPTESTPPPSTDPPETTTPTTPSPPTSSPTTPSPTTPSPSTTTPKPSEPEPTDEPTTEEPTPPETTPPRTSRPPADEDPPPRRTPEPQPNPADPGPPADPEPEASPDEESDWDFRRTLPPNRDFSDPVPTRPFAGSEDQSEEDFASPTAEPEARADTVTSPPSLAQAWMWSAFVVAGALLAGAGWMNYRGRIGRP